MRVRINLHLSQLILRTLKLTIIKSLVAYISVIIKFEIETTWIINFLISALTTKSLLLYKIKLNTLLFVGWYPYNHARPWESWLPPFNWDMAVVGSGNISPFDLTSSISGSHLDSMHQILKFLKNEAGDLGPWKITWANIMPISI